MDSAYYYLHSDTVMAAVIEFYKRQGIHFSTTKKTLLKQLASVGVIKTGDRNTIVKLVNGKRQRFIWLKQSALDSLNSSDEK